MQDTYLVQHWGGGTRAYCATAGVWVTTRREREERRAKIINGVDKKKKAPRRLALQVFDPFWGAACLSSSLPWTEICLVRIPGSLCLKRGTACMATYREGLTRFFFCGFSHLPVGWLRQVGVYADGHCRRVNVIYIMARYNENEGTKRELIQR